MPVHSHLSSMSHCGQPWPESGIGVLGDRHLKEKGKCRQGMIHSTVPLNLHTQLALPYTRI